MNISNQSVRNTIYFDESGTPSFNDEGRFFILTGVIANNLEFSSLAEYYFRLKLKYFKEEREIHSNNLFWKPKEKDIAFINELVEYLDTLDFSFLTVIINKKQILKDVDLVSPKNPFHTTFSKAKSIYQTSGFAKEKFREKTIQEILNLVKEKKIPNIYNYKPLKVAYYTILKKYLNEYVKKTKLENSSFEICFETSPNRERILKYTEEFFEERRTNNFAEKTNFARDLKENMYSISFPNKSAKYLGLEIADIISYGFNLSKNKRINSVSSYTKVWDIISKRRSDLKKEYEIDCVYNIPTKRVKKKK